MLLFKAWQNVLSVVINNLIYIDKKRFKREHKQRLKAAKMLLYCQKYNQEYNIWDVKKDSSNNSDDSNIGKDDEIYRRQDKSIFELIASLPFYIRLYIKQQRYTDIIMFMFALELISITRYMIICAYFSIPSTNKKFNSNSSLVYFTLVNPYGDMSMPTIVGPILLGVVVPAFSCRLVYLIRSLNIAWKNEKTYNTLNIHSFNIEFLSKLQINFKFIFKTLFEWYAKNKDDKEELVLAENSIESQEIYSYLAPIDKLYYYNQFDYRKFAEPCFYFEPQWVAKENHKKDDKDNEIEVKKEPRSVFGKVIDFVGWPIATASQRQNFLPKPYHMATPRTMVKILSYAVFNALYGVVLANIYFFLVVLIMAKTFGHVRDPTLNELSNFIKALYLLYEKANPTILAIQAFNHCGILYFYTTHLIDIDAFLYSNILLIGKLEQVKYAISIIFIKCEKRIDNFYPLDDQFKQLESFTRRNSAPKKLESKQDIDIPKVRKPSKSYISFPTSYDISYETLIEKGLAKLKSRYQIKQTTNKGNNYVLLPACSFSPNETSKVHKSFGHQDLQVVDDINNLLKMTIEWLLVCNSNFSDIKELYTFNVNATGVGSVFVLSYLMSIFYKFTLTFDEYIFFTLIVVSVSKTFIGLFSTGASIESKVSYLLK